MLILRLFVAWNRDNVWENSGLKRFVGGKPSVEKGLLRMGLPSWRRLSHKQAMFLLLSSGTVTMRRWYQSHKFKGPGARQVTRTEASWRRWQAAAWACASCPEEAAATPPSGPSPPFASSI